MKKFFLKHKIIYIVMVLAVLAIVIGFYIYSRSSSNQMQKPEQTQSYSINTPEMQEAENNLRSSVNNATELYINTTYPNATILNTNNDLLNIDYSVVLVSYSENGQDFEKRIYLENSGESWTVIHEDENMISCEKVTELIQRENVLTSVCTE